MICPKCSSADLKVIDTRINKGHPSIRRRRECAECHYRFSTIEEILKEDVVVVKQDGRREPFDRSKIVNGISRAIEKRPIENEQLNLLIGDLMKNLESEFDFEIPSQAIGEGIMTRLKNIDKIAYVRFASIYKDFRDISEFAQAISDLDEQPSK